MNPYHKEQIDTLLMVSRYIASLSSSDIKILEETIADYLAFRKQVDKFLDVHFGNICTRKCYESDLSACCSKEGIITFFADVVINVLCSEHEDINALLNILQKPDNGYKCIYLGKNGCMWQVKPIVCEMFLCDVAKNEIFNKDDLLRRQWEKFEVQRKLFTWPDKPVLFDMLERYFLDAGYSSPLMYMNNSPGLLRVKRKAQNNNINERIGR